MTRNKINTEITSKNIIERYREFRKYPDKVTYDERVIILKFMFELTRKGFEQYIADYFKKIIGVDVAKVMTKKPYGIIDIGCKKNNKFIAIQCKKRSEQPIQEGDILHFLNKIKETKQKLGETLSIYYITTNRLNKDAWKLINENGINARYYKDIIRMNKKFNIDNFIKEYKKDTEIISGINVKNILNKFYYKKGFGRFLGDIAYFIDKYILSKFINYELDFDKAEKESKNKDDSLFLGKI